MPPPWLATTTRGIGESSFDDFAQVFPCATRHPSNAFVRVIGAVCDARSATRASCIDRGGKINPAATHQTKKRKRIGSCLHVEVPEELRRPHVKAPRNEVVQKSEPERKRDVHEAEHAERVGYAEDVPVYG
jgi:hypothetical protein